MLEKILLLHNKTKMAVGETMHKYVVHQSYHKIPKVSAGAYIIFSKAPFDVHIFGGGYVWREFGLPYSWKEIYVSNFARSFL